MKKYFYNCQNQSPIISYTTTLYRSQIADLFANLANNHNTDATCTTKRKSAHLLLTCPYQQATIWNLDSHTDRCISKSVVIVPAWVDTTSICSITNKSTSTLRLNRTLNWRTISSGWEGCGRKRASSSVLESKEIVLTKILLVIRLF